MSEKEVGRTQDVGFQIGVSRTVPHPLDVVWRFLVSADGLAVWLGAGVTLSAERGSAYRTAGGTVGEVRSLRELDRVRLTWRPPGWDHDTTLQVALTPSGNDRTSITFHQEWLADADERARQRAHWRGVVGAVADGLLVESLALLHTGLGAVWLGSMAYSLVVVQPRAARLLGEQRYEEFAAVLAAGARWSVLAFMAGLALTGSGLVALTARAGDSPGTAWWSVVGAKVALLLVALAVFAQVSWRLWPRRIFALPDELPAIRRSFRVAAVTLAGLVGAQFVLGAVASAG